MPLDQRPMGATMNVIIKLLGTGISMGAAFLANKAISKAWEKKTGHKPPKSTDDLEHTWKQALLWAMLTTFVATLIQLIAGRTAQRAIAKYTHTRDEV
jgi:uncharacterized BrkB/YihY/UPF0761 family membrane protein